MPEQEPIEIPKPLDQLTAEEIIRKACIGKIMTYTLKSLTDTYINKGFQWLLPIELSQSTDPLWPDPGASIEKRIEIDIYGKPVRTTTSMIIHKLVATSTAYPKLFILAPNIRIEKAERAKTGKHIYEFTQLDFEIVDADSKDVFALVEEAIITLIKGIKKNLKKELTTLGRLESIKTPKAPFKIYDRADLEVKYGINDWETGIINDIKEPAWIINIPRQFYDFEDFKTGRWNNYDLFLPQFGEVLSGSKREYEYKKIIKKIERDQVKKENYALITKMAKDGRLKPTAGAGIGMERLVGWLTGVKHIAECQPFPRVPGNVNEL
ncbi:MAG: asparagine synthetase A [Nitrososphaerota archaeon]|jgi:asparaginyl-tRNA synthetase|nr:asparagine synthetase A [Nitrososphaerota archaeon]